MSRSSSVRRGDDAFASMLDVGEGEGDGEAHGELVGEDGDDDDDDD
jgi:hypothetical protein